MIKKGIFAAVVFFMTASLTMAGGWDKKKGLDQVTLEGELLCIGCTLKKMNGANAQCNLYSQHAIGFKAKDGTLWNLVDNAKGHDVIMGHNLLNHKQATIQGWIYPLAHMIEIDSIKVAGISPDQIAATGYAEDMLRVKMLQSRKVGQPPAMGHKHEGHSGHKH